MARRKSGLDFTRRREKKKLNIPLIREIVVFGIEIAIAVGLGFVLVYFLGLRTTVIGRAMEETLYASDEIMIDRFRYRIMEPKQGDVIVFLPNGNEKSYYYVRRVVGVPGDTVEIDNGRVLVNGEPYEGNGDFPLISDPGVAEEPVRLGTDEYFVLGDNTNESEDSRFADIGNVSKEFIIGKAWYVLHSEHHKGFIH
jgi:signal peptidase I